MTQPAALQEARRRIVEQIEINDVLIKHSRGGNLDQACGIRFGYEQSLKIIDKAWEAAFADAERREALRG
jgi:hypothetical protein